MIERDRIDISSSQATEPEQPAMDSESTPVPVSELEKDNSSLPPEELERLTDDLVEAFKSIYDPEIPVDIYELGLIYKVDVSDDRDVEVDMTLTAPGCPVAGDMPGWVENAAAGVPGVRSVKVNLVFDPPWDPSKMSEVARLELNMF